eukprot:1097652-Pelagomonas_calceolata.AAC.5
MLTGAAGDTIVHGPATPNGANSPNGASQGGCNGVLEEDTDEGESGSDAGSRDDGNVDEEMFYAEMAAHADNCAYVHEWEGAYVLRRYYTEVAAHA